MTFQMQLFAYIILKIQFFLTESRGHDGTKLFSLPLDAIENVFPKLNLVKFSFHAPEQDVKSLRLPFPDSTPGVK